MKKLTLVIFLVLSTETLWADSWLKNSDFSDGNTDWIGDGKVPSDYAEDSAMDGAADPITSKGLIVELKNTLWTKVRQDFRNKESEGTLKITYMVSKDFSFSDKPEYYQNVPYQIDFGGWWDFNIPKGSWAVFITDMGAYHENNFDFKPKPKPGEPQTVKEKIGGFDADSDKTIMLAFPPGKGMIVLLNVSIESN